MNTDWNKIFSYLDGDYNAYSEQLSKNRKYYRSINPEEYRTISDCVEFAIREGNHAAFAHFFLREERSRKRVFGKTLSDLLAKQERVPGFDRDECWKFAPVIQQDFWRSYDFQYTEKNIFQNIPGKKKTIVYSMDREKGIESPQRSNWKGGKGIPTRDVIVQLAICLGLSPEDTNRLLQAAGKNSLYVLDLVDVCSMFMIRDYENDFSITPLEKLQITKENINDVLEELRNNKSDKLVPTQFLEMHILGAKDPLGENIDEEIDGIRQCLESSGVGHSGDTVTYFLTNLYKSSYQKAQSIGSFLKPLSGTDEQGPDFGAFLQKYYGFLHKTKEFMEKTSNYDKNLRFTGWALTAQSNAPVDFSQFPFSIERRAGQNTAYSEQLKQILRIWYIADLADEFGREFRNGGSWVAPGRQFSSFSIPKQMVEGRKKNKAYVMDFGNKVHLMRLAIATGNEDEAPKYLQLAGFWERDWYDACRKNKDKCYENLDRSDCLLIYALMYRDRLIEIWKENKDYLYASRVHRAFPMIKLLLTINRDITLALMKLEIRRDYDTAGEKGEKHESDLVALQDDMIFPVAWDFKYKDLKNKYLQLNQGIEGGEYGRGEETIEMWRKQVGEDEGSSEVTLRLGSGARTEL